MKKKLIVVLCVFCLSKPLTGDCQQVNHDSYIPEPLLFVHGFGKGNKENWNRFAKYLDDRGLLSNDKYKVKEQLYKLANYRDTLSNGSIAEIGTYVESEIRRLYEAHERPVKVVAHSMGGLATRYAFNKNPQLIDSVIFCGVPHLGSPLASGLWIFNEIVQNKECEHLLREIWTNTLSGKPQELLELNTILLLNTISRKIMAYYLRLHLTFFFGNTVKNIDQKKQAVSDLRVTTGPVYYAKTFSAKNWFGQYSFDITKEHGTLSIEQADIYNSLGIPAAEKRKSLVGEGWHGNIWGFGNELAQEILIGGDFDFPAGMSLQDLKYGDGVVPLISQGALGVDWRSHGYFSDHGKETEDIEGLLTLIDDAPKVKRIRVMDAPPYARGSVYSAFIIIKAEEYFLADLEIEKLRLNGLDVTHRFLAPMWEVGDTYRSSAYRPYKQFGHDFLRRRGFVFGGTTIRNYALTEQLWLDPGEFYVYLSGLSNGRAHTVSITLKNPAGKTKEVSFQFSRPVITKVKIPLRYDEHDNLVEMELCVKEPTASNPHHDDYDYTCSALEGVNRIPIRECIVYDPLFNTVRLDVALHRTRPFSYRFGRVIKTLRQNIIVGNARLAQRVGPLGFWDGTDRSKAKVLPEYDIYPTVQYADVSVRGFGLNASGRPALSIEGDDLSGSSGALTIMGTNFDESPGWHRIFVFKCDPAFMQPPRLNPIQTVRAPVRGARDEFHAYMAALGIRAGKKEQGRGAHTARMYDEKPSFDPEYFGNRFFQHTLLSSF